MARKREREERTEQTRAWEQSSAHTRVIEPVRAGIVFAWQLRKLFGDDYEFDRVGRMLTNAAALAALRNAEDPSALPAFWHDDLQTFLRIRQQYLL